MQTALVILAAYILGSVPFAVISARLFGLADPRSYGSGNPGATNVLRSGNKKAALFTLLGDALKGWVAIFVAQRMGLSDNMIGLDPLLGLAVIGTWLFVALAFRYSSLAAILAAAMAPVYFLLMHGANSQIFVIGIIAMALIGKHWQNFQRLLAGQEARIGSKKKS